MNLDPQTMARLMQQAGPMMQQTLQGGAQPQPQQQPVTYPHRVVAPGDIVSRPRPGRDNYEMQDQYVRAQPGQGMPSLDYSKPQPVPGQPGAPGQPGMVGQQPQGPVPAGPISPMQDNQSPADLLMALQSLYGKQV